MDDIEDKLDAMSKDELLALCVELYEDAKKKIDAGEGSPELEAACEHARKSIAGVIEMQKGDGHVH
jgi:hypothetical protein